MQMSPVTEIKRTLAGAEKRFECRLLAGGTSHVVLLWISPSDMNVQGIELPAGTVTFAHYWTDRPYNVYHWHDRAAKTLGYYFNIADETRVQPGLVTWRDLVVDVLVRPGGRPEVLDREELPAALPDDLRATIEAGVEILVGDIDRVLREVDAGSRRLYPRVFPEAS
jgi:predicted RNA-binding protein associated with RNAse of E/G family